MTGFYAGIGSRRTPADFLLLMTAIAIALRDLGWTLRSGHADGADLAFENGAQGQAEIYLPWRSFNDSVLVQGTKVVGMGLAAQPIAAEHHPMYDRLSPAVRSMMMRNVGQVLGRECDQRSSFVVCWTPDGAWRREHTSQRTGGTGQAIRVADAYGVPVFNLQREEHCKRLVKFVEESR